jgi:dihydrofolate reductase
MAAPQGRDRPATVALIAAVARNGAIGRDNQLLWHLPEDLKFFRATTLGCPVVMGRKTWESLPARFRPLPGRRNVIVTRNRGWAAEGAAGVDVVHDLPAALALLADVPRAFVIGGAQLYAAALPFADELVLTEVDADFDGDVQFPAWDRGAFTAVSQQRQRAAAPNHFDVSFTTYRRTGAR